MADTDVTLLQQKINELSAQVYQVKSIVDAAPFPIGVYIGREMRIKLVNQSIIEVWGKGNDIVGRLYSEVLPELANTGIYDQLDQVFTTGIPYEAKSQRVDLVIDGVMQIFYFDYTFTPLFDDQGKIYGVMNTAADVTQLNLAKQELEQSRKNFHNMILQAPVAMSLMLGPEHTVEVANDLIIDLWGKPREQVLGKPIFEGLPDAKGQGLEKMLADVYHTGKTFRANEQPVSLLRNGETQIIYQNFVYEPYKDSDGTTLGIIAITNDVTEQVLARKELENSYKEQQKLNEELAGTNEELSAANEQVAATNEELLKTQGHLSNLVNQLEWSESRLRYIMEEAPVAIAVMHGRDMVIESANRRILEIWGKTPDVIGKNLTVALPELKGQPFLDILDEVFTSGKPFMADEARVVLEHQGTMKEIFCNFVYQPVINNQGETTDIIAVAIDVTLQVNSRKQVERAEELLRIATEAAEVGVWSMDPNTNEWTPSAQVKNIFGVRAEDPLSYQSTLAQIREDYSETVDRAVRVSLNKGEPFNIEYPIKNAKDGKERWIRSVGKMITGNDGLQGYLTGALIDISQQKQEVQRKNDFIGMVSHELKTPLTSLKAIMQVLARKLQGREDPFISDGFERANVQVKKMAGMINGFLNLSRLESGKIVLNKEPFKLDELIGSICEESRIITHDHRIIFEPCEPVTVFADRDKIGSVITNLLSNALKYSPEGTDVTIGCTLAGNMAQVSVKDSGIGINPDELDKIFTRYYRVQSDEMRHISGFGIGLYLSSEIIERHHGRIWATSEPGRGSIFYFALPLG